MFGIQGRLVARSLSIIIIGPAGVSGVSLRPPAGQLALADIDYRHTWLAYLYL
jgi:hypothetical protein